MNKLSIPPKQPDEKEFEQVKQLAENLQLDNDAMKPGQFRVISDNGKVIAFGRLKEHEDALELCTLGVSKEFRKKGLGGKMVRHLLSEAKDDVHIVTIIPGFFAKLGFDFVEKYPASLREKQKTCSTQYSVGEPYRVMRWKKK